MKKSNYGTMTVADASEEFTADESSGNGYEMRISVMFCWVPPPDREVDLFPKHRRFSLAYKAYTVEEVERCTQSGEAGALLRCRGVYSSYVSKFREQYRAGGLSP